MMKDDLPVMKAALKCLCPLSTENQLECAAMVLHPDFPDDTAGFIVRGIKTMAGFFHIHHCAENGGGESLRYYADISKKEGPKW